MTDDPARKNGRKTRGRPFSAEHPGKPFAPGNPGRPKGSRNATTRVLEALLDGEAEEIVRKAIELAKSGDGPAMRAVLDRLLAPRKDRPVTFELPPINTFADLSLATAALLRAVAMGDLTPSEATEFAKLIEAHVRAIEATELAERVAKLEGAFR
jgi:hypothetical protein